MRSESNNGVVGAVLIGVGVGLAAAGVALVVPACMNWSAGMLEQAVRRGKESVGTAAASLGDFAGHAQSRFSEAAKSAKTTTSRAAGAVETAARNLREYTS